MNEFFVVRSSKDDTMCNVKYRIPFPMPSFVVIDTSTEIDMHRLQYLRSFSYGCHVPHFCVSTLSNEII
jgi:hypothetical protein